MNPGEPQVDVVAPRGRRRAMCARCRRPVRVCYCAALTSIETRSRVVILQHPREEGMPIGTAHIAHLCLRDSRLHVGIHWDGGEVLREVCGDAQRPPVLLYPGRGARDILRDPPTGPVTLIVVDGTWSQARTVVRENPVLAALPRYAFHAPEPSNYRIRREPSEACVSTIEALMHGLGALEGDPERFLALRRPMDAMVDAHLSAQREEQARASPPREPRRRTRPSRSTRERLPAALRERPADLVLVGAEANAWPYGTPERRHGDELVHWVAHRPCSGETFSFVLAPRNPLAPDIPGHTGLARDELLSGSTVPQLLESYAAFSRPTDLVCAWGHHGLRLWRDCGGTLPGTFLDLQGVARTLTPAKVGTLQTFAARAGAAPPLPLAPGRAGRRLALLAALLAGWLGRDVAGRTARDASSQFR